MNLSQLEYIARHMWNSEPLPFLQTAENTNHAQIRPPPSAIKPFHFAAAAITSQQLHKPVRASRIKPQSAHFTTSCSGTSQLALQSKREMLITSEVQTKCKPTQGLQGLGRALKVWEKWDQLFKALKVWENWAGSVKVCEFCGLWSAREKLSVYRSEIAFPKTEQ